MGFSCLTRCLMVVAIACSTLTTLPLCAETAPALSAKAEAATIEFARTNHAELASLLEQLKTNAPSEYRSAMIELDRTRERLERSREKMPERAEIELAEWKVNSRIRLMAARLAMGGDASLEADLKAALQERLDLRVQLMNEERTRLRRRLEKLDENIAEQERRSADQVEKEFASLKRGASASATAAKKNAKTSKPEESKSIESETAPKTAPPAKPEKRVEKKSDKKPPEKKTSKP